MRGINYTRRLHTLYIHMLLCRCRSDGSPITSYGDFIEYLMAKSPLIHAVEMDFEGKNVLLYYCGDVVPMCDRPDTSKEYPQPSAYQPQIVRRIATPEVWWKLSNPKKYE